MLCVHPWIRFYNPWVSLHRRRNSVKFKQIPAMGTNCYIFWDENSNNAVCIDPGFTGRKIAKEIQKLGLTLTSIFITHSHTDHVSGLDDMCAELKVNPVVYLSRAELRYEEFPFKGCWGNNCSKRFWEDNSMVVIDSMEFKVIPMPGHSPGSVCITVDEFIISGDLISNTSIGRTDFSGSNVKSMIHSIEKLLQFPDTMKVLPGHDNTTTIKNIKEINPYVRQILQQE